MPARSKDLKVDTPASDQAVSSGEAAGKPSTKGTVQTEVKTDESDMRASYANFARVTGTPEEIIVDFGLNPQPVSSGTQEVKIDQRLIMNFYTAKRLLAALNMSIQRHEGAFGALELDVLRRANVAAAAPRPAAGAS